MSGHGNNGHNVLPTSPAEVWPYMRDNAKPLTPLDAWYLSQCRTYTPPSKAHVKRLLKLRPRFSTAPKPIAPDHTERAYHNDAAQIGRETRQLAQRAVLVERVLAAPVTLKAEPVLNRLPAHMIAQSKVRPEVDEWDMDRITRNIARLKAEHEHATRS